MDNVITEGGFVQGVTTNKGDISCRIFINCAGQVIITTMNASLLSLRFDHF
jgi:hypothetical protein